MRENRPNARARPCLYYTPVLERNTLNASIRTAKQILTDNMINEKFPNTVSSPAPLFAVASQNNVVNALKKLVAKLVRSEKPLSIAEIIELAIFLPPYIYNFNIYYIYKICNKKIDDFALAIYLLWRYLCQLLDFFPPIM